MQQAQNEIKAFEFEQQQEQLNSDDGFGLKAGGIAVASAPRATGARQMLRTPTDPTPTPEKEAGHAKRAGARGRVFCFLSPGHMPHLANYKLL